MNLLERLHLTKRAPKLGIHAALQLLTSCWPNSFYF
jgi:hypothetical protein